jgi:hypothetical protein
VRNERLETVFHWDPEAALGPKPDPGAAFVLNLPAGIYQMQVSVGAGEEARSWEKFVRVLPPQVEVMARIEP